MKVIGRETPSRRLY